MTLRLGGHYLPLAHHRLGHRRSTSCSATSRRSAATPASPACRRSAIGPLSLERDQRHLLPDLGLLAAATLLVAATCSTRAPGRAIRACAAASMMVESLGVDAFRIRLVTFVIAALLAGALGLALRAHAAIRQPDAVRRAHGHRIPVHGVVGGAGTSGAPWSARRCVTAAEATRCRMCCRTCSRNGAQLEVDRLRRLLIVLVLQFARGGADGRCVLRYAAAPR